MSDMSPPVGFDCCNCQATYEVVRVEAAPEPTTNREIVCPRCGGPLQVPEDNFILKYLLVRRSEEARLISVA
jgi:DNA-directed RNA polymerase subunit RPC12/RpoP